MSCELVPVKYFEAGARPSFESVFRPEETDYYLYPDGWQWRSLEEPPRNPGYRDDLTLRGSTLNIARVIRDLGYELEDGGTSIPINEFLAVATQWLRRNIGRRSAAIPERVAANGQRILGGVDEGYISRQILKASMIAREGRQRGATHVFVG